MDHQLDTLPLPIKEGQNKFIPVNANPTELQLTWRSVHSLPGLAGELGITAPGRFKLILRVHNRAGIPIVEGQSYVEIGQRRFVFEELDVIGIEAYAHVSVEERQKIRQRIWSRRAYATLQFWPIS